MELSTANNPLANSTQQTTVAATNNATRSMRARDELPPPGVVVVLQTHAGSRRITPDQPLFGARLWSETEVTYMVASQVLGERCKPRRREARCEWENELAWQ